MTTMRLLPPIAPGRQTISVNGRSHTCQIGSTIDVPDFDAGVMCANGWTSPGPVRGSGATSARPATFPSGTAFAIPPGFTWLDTTLGYIIVWDGATWRNPATAAAV